MVTIQFDMGINTVNESDGSVTINLVRMGDLTDNISVSIGITMIMDPAIIQCMSMHICDRIFVKTYHLQTRDKTHKVYNSPICT